MDLLSAIPNADVAYRERKARTHALMRRVLRGAPVVQHDFHLPAEQSQNERDRRFWLECRWAVTGPEIEARPRRQPDAANGRPLSRSAS